MNEELHHPLTRPSVVKLPKITTDLAKREEWVEKGAIDLASSINPWAKVIGRYPPLKSNDCSKLYLSLQAEREFSVDQLRSHPFRKASWIPARTNSPAARQYKNLTDLNVLFTRGSSEAIDLLIRSFCEPNLDRICILDPTFPLYEYFASTAGVETNRIHLTGPAYNEFDPQEVCQLQAKIVFLCSPGNPVGSSIPEPILLSLLDHFKGIVAVDEAYIEFSSKPSALRWVHQYPNLAILRTFSKAWGIAGARCGALIAQNPLLTSVSKVQGPFSLPSTTASALLSVLKMGPKRRKQVEIICEEREKLRLQLANCPAVLEVFNSDTNFLLVRFQNFQKAQKAFDELLHAGLLVHSANSNIPGTLRIAIGTKAVNQRLIHIIRNILPDTSMFKKSEV